jgi:alcohol dehydrogenase
MDVYRFSRLKDLDSLTRYKVDIPRPQRGEVLIRVRATSLNYRDLALVRGKYSSAQRLDLVPLSDAAGEVVQVGQDVTELRAGDRVVNAFHPRWFAGPQPLTMDQEAYGSYRDGWLAEYKVVSQEAVVKFPAELSFEQACTLPCAGVTAWTSIRGLQPLAPGGTVLTLGTGGVSTYAVLLARQAFGARVIATTSSDEKAQRLRDMGADHVINYTSVPNWGEVARELSGGRGVDRVVEIGGPATLPQSIAAVTPGGEISLVGFLGGGATPVDYRAIFKSRAVLNRISVGSRADLEDLVRAVATTGVRPLIDEVFPFADALGAWRKFSDRDVFGKIVISNG